MRRRAPAPVAGAPRSMAREPWRESPPRRLRGGGCAPSAAAPEPSQAEEVRASVEVQAFQAIYSIAGRVTVPTTGEAKRVQIDEAQLDPALTVRTVPKRDQKAYLYAKMTMARGTPILPGQVSLFRDATFVGNGRLPLLAPGEEHELGFGVDDSVRVRHTIAEEKRGETGIITSSKTDTRNYRITVKNLHERAIQVAVLDQIPVSQNADIKVELLGKTAPTKRDLDDKRGVLAWEMKLEPDEEKADRVRLPRHLAGGQEDHLRQLSSRSAGGYLQTAIGAAKPGSHPRMRRTVRISLLPQDVCRPAASPPVRQSSLRSRGRRRRSGGATGHIRRRARPVGWLGRLGGTRWQTSW